MHVRPEEVFVVEASVQRGGQALRTVEPFVWHSTDPAIAAVQGNGSVAQITGGVTGQTQVRVTIGEAECSVPVINYGRPAEDEVRLVILHSTGRRGIHRARVLLVDGEEVVAETTSGPDGVARLPRPGAERFDVHVLAPTEAGSLLPEAKHLSILDNEETDLLLVLPPAPAMQRVAFTGEVDVQDLRVFARHGDVWLSIQGASIPEHVLDLSLATFLGDIRDVHVRYQTLIDQRVPWPSSFVMGIGNDAFSADYVVHAFSGRRTAWSLGGVVTFIPAIQALLPVFEGEICGEVSVGAFLAAGLSLPTRGFGAGSIRSLEVYPSSSTELRLVPEVALRMRLEVEVPRLPMPDSQFPYAVAALVVGLEEEGLVPLGMRGARLGDPLSDPIGWATGFDPVYDGQAHAPGWINVRAAPPGEILPSGPYHLAVLTFDACDLSRPWRRTPDAIAGLVIPVESLGWKAKIQAAHNFLPYATQDLYGPAERRYSPGEVAVAATGDHELSEPPITIRRLSITAVDGAGWVVYMPGDRNDPVILPAIGDRMCGDDTCLDPVGGNAAWRAELLHTTHSLPDLVRFDDADLGRLFRRLRGFSSLLLQEE